MISWMQKHRKYLVITIWISTFAFVAAGFVGWGAYSYNQDRANAIAKVGDVRITGKELQQTYSNLYNYYNKMLGGQLTKEKAEELKLQDIALNQLMREALLLNYAKELGISVLDSEVIAELQRIDTFKSNGVFSKEKYFQVLKSLGTNAKDFEKSLKKEIAIEKLRKVLKLPVTPLETESIAAAMYLADKLKIKIIPAHPESVTVSDEEVKKYWEANKARYQSPKTYTLEVIEINATDIVVSDEDLKSFYEEKKYRFKDENDKILPFEKAKEEVRKAVQMKKAKTEALKKYLALKAGKIKPQRIVTVDENDQRFPIAKLAKTAVGEFVKSIPSAHGYMTAKLIKVAQPEPLPFEKAKELAQNDLLIEKRFAELEDRAKKEVERLEGAKETPFVTHEDVEKIPGLTKEEAVEFLNHLFSQKGQKGYYLFKDKAVAYEIVAQKLLDRESLEKNRTKLEKAAETIKQNDTQNGLIRRLEKRYSIEKYYKG
ncbi:MAG: hypothetical protein B6D59_04325 [Campylobacteraceae bacterium 4484_4]|nr:MAG: hypothetical protein B6D59_04325 [Campylobacteraceae bacterium 4484_4]